MLFINSINKIRRGLKENSMKNFNLSGTSKSLQLGRRGAFLRYENNRLKVEKDSVIVNIQTGTSVDDDDCISRAELNSLDITSFGASELGKELVEYNDKEDIKESLGIFSNSTSRFTNITASTTLEKNRRYYISEEITVTLPDTNSVDIGDVVEIRNKFDESFTIEVFNTLTESIVTEVSSSDSLLVDVPSFYTFIFNGQNWEAY